VTLTSLARRMSKLASDNSPVILTAIGVAGVLSTAYLTVRATVKAVRAIDAENDVEVIHSLSEKPEDEYLLPLNAKQCIQLCWKYYIPPVASALVSVAAIVTANRVESRRAVAIATAYAISERAFDEYRAKVIEKIGAKKEQTYRDEIAQERVTREPVSNAEIVFAGNGESLCHDSFSGRYFTSDMETLRKAQNDLNHQILNDSYASLTDFYDRIGLKRTGISDDVGWNTDRMVELNFSTVLSDDGRPCLSVSFNVTPTRNFNRFH
jgi:hypothetical protein